MKSFDLRNQFVFELLSGKNSAPLLSFEYDGKFLDNRMLPRRETACRKFDGGEHRELELIVSERLTIKVELDIFDAFPFIEYQIFAVNSGDAPSGVIENFMSLDFTAALPQYGAVSTGSAPSDKLLGGGRLTVRHSLGSYCVASDFVAQKNILWSRPGANQLTLECTEGRSSSAYMPFFGVDTSVETGIQAGIGWSGAWKAEFEIPVTPEVAPEGTTFRIRAGMKRTRFRVFPGETLRLPAIFIQFRAGGTERDGMNLLRRFMLAHHSPRDSQGKIMPPPISFVTWGGLPQTQMLDRLKAITAHQLPYEVFWIDAGWSGYDGECPHFFDRPSDWPLRVGNLRVNRSPHPDGLKPLADAVHAAKMRFLVWFEPERLHRASQSPLLTEHPDFLLSIPGSDSLLFDLGNSKAWNWLDSTLKKFIRDNGIDIYRQDFNFDPAPYWSAADAPDRVGVSEMKHIDGLYRLWTSLRKEFPDLLIDNCASGGRRLDFMLLSDSIPLCQSDYACYPDRDGECVQIENFYLNDWLPLHTGFSWHPQHDAYDLLSAVGVGTSSKIWQFESRRPAPDHDWNDHRNMLENIYNMREIQLDADFYPLSASPELLDNWCAAQTHDPHRERGFILAFRRRKSQNAELACELNGIDPKATYETRDHNGAKSTISGADLRQLTLKLPFPGTVILLFYQKK